MSKQGFQRGRGSGLRGKIVSACTRMAGALLLVGVVGAGEARAVPYIFQSSGITKPTAGGAVLYVDGYDFSLGSDTYVTVGGKPCPLVWPMFSTTTLMCYTPEGSGRFNDVVVTDATGASNAYNYAYDPPTLDTVSPANGPAAGNTLLTIHGVNFGPSDSVRSVTVDGKECSLSAGLSTHTDIYCFSPAGSGTNRVVSVTVDGQASTNTKSFHYDPPAVSSVLPANGPKAGNITITLQGTNFGPAGTSRSILVGGNACPPAPGSDGDGEVTCTLPSGQGTGQAVTVTIDGQSNSSGPSFAYDAASLSSLDPSNGPTSGQTLLTLSGANFSSSGNTVTVDGATCTPSFESNSSIRCSTPPGTGAINDVRVTDGAGSTTSALNFVYDSPSVTGVVPATGAAAGGTRITISGSNFGPSTADALRSVTVGGQSCPLVPGGNDHTRVVCDAPPGLGLGKDVRVTVDGLSSSPNTLFGYEPPVVSGITPSTGPKAGNITITVQGTNFGPAGTLRSISVGGSACPATPGEDSDAAVTCTLPSGEGANRAVVVTVAGQSSVAGATFSYAAPSLSSVFPTNGPTTGGTSLTLTGSDFSASGNTVSVDGAACPLSFESSTSIRCSAPAGTGQSNNVVVSDSAGSASNAKNFAYDAPSVGSFSPSNGPTSGNTRLTINGSNFGPAAADGVRSVTVGGQACTIVPGQSTQIRVVCDTPQGSGTNKEVRVTIDGQAASSSSFFSYDAPTLSSVSPSNGPTAGTNTLTLTGTNFGPSGNTVTVGGANCPVTLHGTGRVECTAPEGVGIGKNVQLSVGSQSSNTATYNYDGPTISGVTPQNGPKAGGSVITIQGNNFGPAGTSRTISVGGVTCPPAAAVDGHTAISCTLPSGQGKNQAVVVTRVGQSSSGGATYSYGDPVLSSINPSNGPTNGITSLTLQGSDFSPSGNSVTVDGVSCPIGSQDRSQVICTVPAGTGATNAVVLTDAVSGASNSKNFAYDAPTVLTMTPSNGPTAGNVPITIQGTNFGPASADAVRNVTVDGAACTPVPGQSSHGVIRCTLPSGSGRNRAVTVSVDGQSANTAALSFHYDAPSTLSVEPTHGPTAGNVPITVRGSNFAPSGNAVSVDGQSCAIDTEDVSTIVCSLPEGTGVAKPVAVNADGQASNAQSFSYDVPVLTSLDPGNGPTAGSISLTIRGQNFGGAGADSLRSVTVGTAACPLVPSASSHEAIQCTLPAGQGLGNTVHVEVDSQAGNERTFDYDAPQITSITPANPPEAGGVPITIHGSNFGLTASATVGGSACPPVSQTHSSFVCTLPAGSGADVPVSLTVSGQQALSTLDYKARVCGDGVNDPDEDCDDSNTSDLDGCSAACETEHVQDKDQAGCILALNKAGAAVSKAQAKGIADCAKDATAGVPCIGASEPAGVAKAREKAASAFAKKCAALPDFGPVDATVMADAAVDAEIALARDILGADADAALVPNSGGQARTMCQKDVRAAWEKMVAASLKAFSACKKDGLKEQAIRATSQLDACLGYIDEDGNWAKASAGLGAALTDSCAGVDLADAFPGACASTSDREACIRDHVRCNTCHLLVIGDRLDADCDLFDDGSDNASCD